MSEPAQRLVFVCCGNGPQWWGMGRGLLEHSAVFRQSVEECDQSLRRFTSTSLLHELLRDEANSRMDQTDVAQPALFALQVGLIAVWRSWGINADATVGHSVGEIAAAWASGILSLDDAMRVVFHRSRLQARTAGTGRMAAVELTVDEAERSIAPYNGRLCLAAQNGSNSVTISGDTSPLAELIQSLQTRHVACKDLGLDYAFHSRTMDPLQDEFMSSLEGISPKSAHCNFVSTLSGEAIDGRELGAEYWWKQMRQPVRFAPAMASLTAAGCNLFVEIGPHPVLGPYVSECLGETDSEGQVLPSLRRNRDALETMRASLAALYTRGVPINWAELYSDARFVRGPTYPWQKKRHWNEATSEVRRKRSGTINPLLGSALDGPRLEWEAELDVGLLTYLRDHRVRDTAVFPMAGYVEIGLSVGRQVYGGEPCAVEHLEIHKGLTLPEDGAKTIRTLASSDGSFEIVVAAPAVTDGWITLVKGDVRRLDANPPAPWAIEEIRQRCGTEIGHESFYEDLVRRGMNYGPQFRVVERVFAGDGEALGELCSSASVEPEKDDCGWRVTLLDACFQVARAAVAGNMESQTRTYLPVSFRKLLSFSWPSSGAFCHVKSVRIGPDSTTQDLTLLDELGRVLARFEGFRRERFDAQRDRLDDSLYELRWEDSPLREDDTSGFSTVP
ncbi:MAG: acyltransferase domain-containing protein, partial [Planctomycetaceae bacterium]